MSTKRLNWLKFLYPGQDGLQAEQNYWNEHRKLHMEKDHPLGIIEGLGVTADAPVSTKVKVAAGRAIDPDGNAIVVASIQEVDLVGLAGVVYVVAEFTETSITSYNIPETGGSQYKYIQDGYTLSARTAAPTASQVELARVDHSAGGATIDDASDPNSPAADEIDLRYRIKAVFRDLSFLNKDKSQMDDPMRSTITVGEEGCDFDDLGEALGYISNLTTSETRQFAVLLFEKKNASAWSLSSVITVPQWTHLIGIGKPCLSFTDIAGNLITLSDGASLRNLHIETTGDSWTRVVTMDPYSGIHDVSYRYEYNVTNESHAILVNGTRCRIENYTQLPSTADARKCCQGIKVDNTYCFISDVYLEGMASLLEITAGGDYFVGHGISCIGQFGSGGDADPVVWVTAAVDGVRISNLLVNATTDLSAGMVVCDSGVVLSNVEVRAQTLLGISIGASKLTNFRVYDAYIEASGSVISNGEIDIAFGNAIEVIGPQTIITGVHIDKGTHAAAAIAATNAAADECMIAGCICDNTGGAASIIGMAGADNWLVHGNMVDVATAPTGGAGWDIADEKVI